MTWSVYCDHCCHREAATDWIAVVGYFPYCTRFTYNGVDGVTRDRGDVTDSGVIGVIGSCGGIIGGTLHGVTDTVGDGERFEYAFRDRVGAPEEESSDGNDLSDNVGGESIGFCSSSIMIFNRLYSFWKKSKV